MKKSQLAWMGLFLAAAFMATSPLIKNLNNWAAVTLAPIGINFPLLQAIWIVGGVPLTFLAIIWSGYHSPYYKNAPLRPLIVIILFSGIEVFFKHLIVLPAPHPVPAAHWINRLITYTNITPSSLIWVSQQIFHQTSATPAASVLLRGSFPSGHVFRLTYTAGVLWPHKPARILMLALGASFAVTALGGHWLFDSIGGFLLARAAMAFLNPQKKKSRV